MEPIYWMLPGRLAGRAGPGREPWSLAALRAAGFQAILSLADDQVDPRELRAAGFVHECVPLPPVIPADALTERVCRSRLPRAHEFLEAQLAAGRRVLVHCAGGRDRTALVLAHYVSHSRGLAADDAIRWVRVQRPDALAAAGWERLALRLIRDLAPPPRPLLRRVLDPPGSGMRA